MAHFVCLLRGINVSGKNKIAMAELSALFVTLGFSSVTTYIQSGNIVFSSTDDATTKQLADQISKAIHSQFQYDIPAIVIEKSAFISQATSIPFTAFDLATEGTKVLLTFLSDAPNPDKNTLLLSYVKPPEQLIIADDVIYLHCPNGYGKTKLSNNFIENKLKVNATTRNAKTVQKLTDLLNALPNDVSNK